MIIGDRDVQVLLQDCDQMTLVSLTGKHLHVGPAQPIDDSMAGQAFRTDRSIEQKQADGVRFFVPLPTAPTASGCSPSPSTPLTIMIAG